MKLSSLLIALCCTALLHAQSGSEIMLFALGWNNGGPVLKNGTNITNHPGYDNQPYFMMGGRYWDILYTSFNDSGRADIKAYDIAKKTTRNITTTHDREYSPTLTPDGKHISCILQRDNGVQDLVQYPIKGGDPQVLINTLKVGYHAWVDDHAVMIFALEDSGKNTLRYYDISTKQDPIIATNIGRCLAKRPGSNQMTFVQIQDDSTAYLRAFDPFSKSITTLCKTLHGRDQYVWLDNRTVLMSDGNEIFLTDPGHTDKWIKVPIEGDRTGIKGITRLAVFQGLKYSYMAVVVAE